MVRCIGGGYCYALRRSMINMKVERRIHNGWKEHDSMSDVFKSKLPSLKGMFGKYQYIYTSEKGKISLTQIAASLYSQKLEWEIYSYEELMEDVERFSTKKAAVKRINELLA